MSLHCDIAPIKDTSLRVAGHKHELQLTCREMAWDIGAARPGKAHVGSAMERNSAAVRLLTRNRRCPGGRAV